MLLDKLFGRRSIENPAIPLSDFDTATAQEYGLATGTAATGEVVNRSSSLGIAAFWRGVNLITRDVAKLPLIVYRRLPEGGKERAVRHPAYKLLRNNAHPLIKAFDFKQTLTGHALCYGNGYAYIWRDNAGRPLEMWPLDPEATYPVLERIGNVVKLWYVTRLDGGEERKLPAADVLHIRGLGYDGIRGYDVITYAKETLGLAIGARKYGSIYFKHNARPNVILEYPGELSRDAYQNLRASWERMYQGLDNAHRTAILENGMKATVLSDNAKQSILIEARKFDVKEIANVLGVPPHKLGDDGRTSYASLEQENQAYLDEALDGWLAQWEQECSAKLLTPQQRERDTHFCEFLRSAIVRADLSTRYAAYNTALQGGWLSRDEIRAMENLSPLPDGQGASYYIPLNVTTTDATEEDERTQPETIAEPTPSRAQHELMRITMTRLWRRLTLHAVKAAGKPARFVQWLDEELPARHRQACCEIVAVPLEALRQAGAIRAEITADAIVDGCLAYCRETLLRAAECQPKALRPSVEDWANRTVAQQPIAWTDAIFAGALPVANGDQTDADAETS